MNKIISLVAIAAMTLAMAGCAVNDSTGAIVVDNKSANAAKAVKVGSVTIGYVGPGEIKTVYFFKDETSAKIDFTGNFTISDSTKTGKIDLKVNYFYSLTFFNTAGKDYYYMSGTGNNIDQAKPESNISWE